MNTKTAAIAKMLRSITRLPDSDDPVTMLTTAQIAITLGISRATVDHDMQRGSRPDAWLYALPRLVPLWHDLRDPADHELVWSENPIWTPPGRDPVIICTRHMARLLGTKHSVLEKLLEAGDVTADFIIRRGTACHMGWVTTRDDRKRITNFAR